MSNRLPPGVPLLDADGALSREFLLHRGYCCGNGCRNCPYGFRRLAESPAEPVTDARAADAPAGEKELPASG